MSNKYLGPADRQLIAGLVGVAPKTIYEELRRALSP